MEQNNGKVQKQDDMKKLLLVVGFLSLFVAAIFGLVPMM